MTDDESREFRQALGAYPTGVAVITTHSAGGVAAITVNSFASVSLSPRLVLWSLGDQSDAYATFSAAESWGVSVMASAQEAIAKRFSQNGRSCAEPELVAELGGAPVMKGALARYGCRTFHKQTLGDHLLIVGEVLAFETEGGAALTFHRGKFGAMD